MAFGRKKDTQDTSTQRNVPIYTTDSIITPDGCVAEYVGIVQIDLDGHHTVNGKEFDKYQDHVNKSEVDAVFGVKIQSITIANTPRIIVYGTGVKFVEA